MSDTAVRVCPKCSLLDDKPRRESVGQHVHPSVSGHPAEFKLDGECINLFCGQCGYQFAHWVAS